MKKYETLSENKNTKAKRAEVMTQVVEHLPSKPLNLNTENIYYLA
jgi:hypothetical protein